MGARVVNTPGTKRGCWFSMVLLAVTAALLIRKVM